MTDTLLDAADKAQLDTVVAELVSAVAEMVAVNERTLTQLKQATKTARAVTAERDDAVAQRDHFAEALGEARARIADLEGRPATDSGRAEQHARDDWDGWAGTRRKNWLNE